MNLSQRLRTCAKHPGLDAVIELLTEAADEIDRLSAGKPADVTDERQAFDAWWESKQRETFPKDYSPDRLAGWGAAFKPDAWRAWQARSILALRPVQVPMTEGEKRALISNFFSEGWAKEQAMNLLHDYDMHNGIKPKE